MTQPALSRTVVILAAGDGTRMRSNLPKVLHPLAGRPMLSRIIDVAGSIDATQICIVVAPHSSAAISAACGAQHTYVPQRERRGTGHAVHTALPALHASDGDVVILFGDTPLIQPSTIAAVIADKTTHGATLSLLSFDVPAPHNYGRIVRDAAGTVTAIVEAKNCTPAQALIREANSGIMVASLGWVRSALPRVTPNPLTNEYYLTDLVALAVADHGSGARHEGRLVDRLVGRRERHGARTLQRARDVLVVPAHQAMLGLLARLLASLGDVPVQQHAPLAAVHGRAVLPALPPWPHRRSGRLPATRARGLGSRVRHRCRGSVWP